MDRGKCALCKGHCPPEELDSPEALGKQGAKAQKGRFFWTKPGAILCISQYPGEQRKGGTEYLSPETHSKAVQHWQHIRFALWRGRRFPGVQVDACSRLTLGMPLPCRNGGGCLPLRQGWNHLSGGKRGVPFPARPGSSGWRCHHEGEQNLGLISGVENTRESQAAPGSTSAQETSPLC